jgi:hypothetical protein
MNSTLTQQLRFSIAVMWLVSAMLPLHPESRQQGIVALQHLGLTGGWINLALGMGISCDLLCAWLSWRSNTRWIWQVQAYLVLTYTMLLTSSQPSLWLDPFGSLLKNIPIIGLLWAMGQWTSSERRTS